MADYFKHGNETSGSIKFWVFLDYLRKCLLLNEDSVLWSLDIKHMMKFMHDYIV